MNTKDIVGIPEARKQFAGNLHSHTVNSDGHLTPEEAVDLYRSNGYSFLCLSEHDKYTDYSGRFDSDDFIILPGLEASASLFDEKDPRYRFKTHHMQGILGTREMQKAAKKHFAHMDVLEPINRYGSWDGAAVAQQLCDELRARGCIVFYNHPLWSRVEGYEFEHIRGLTALEIFNYGTVEESGTGLDTTYWDRMLRRGIDIYGYASDDNHNASDLPDSCGGRVLVISDELEHDAIIRALMSGSFYSTSGPEIYAFGVSGDLVYVRSSSCERVNFICGGHINAGGTVIARNAGGKKSLREAAFRLRGDETYVRAECVDEYGRTAWTNAIFLR